MNAKELIEAAEHFASTKNCECDPESGVFNCMGCDIDRMASHILATVRPDDDEPVTRERLEADGWKYYELLHNREEYVHPNGMAIVCDNGEFRRYGTVLQTMRKVRLVATLGE